MVTGENRKVHGFSKWPASQGRDPRVGNGTHMHTAHPCPCNRKTMEATSRDTPEDLQCEELQSGTPVRRRQCHQIRSPHGLQSQVTSIETINIVGLPEDR